MDICEKIAYVKGLAEGLKLDETTKEGKVLLALIDLVGDITEEICDNEDACDEMSEQLDAVDEDLAAIEDEFYGDDECDCCHCDDDDVYEVTCPNCNDTIYLDDEMIDEGSIKCPNCGTDLEFDFDDCDCDGDDCCCDCGDDAED